MAPAANFAPASLIAIRPGAFATIQDLGRPGHRAYGVPPGGAFDLGSHRLANALLGNPPDCATLEMTMWGGTYEATAPLALAWAGPPIEAEWISASGKKRRRLAQVPQTLNLKRGERIAFGSVKQGMRAYLATWDGWRTPVVLNSRSRETPIRAGDALSCSSGRTWIRRLAESCVSVPADETIRVVNGPDADAGPSLKEALVTIQPQSNRMGLRIRLVWGRTVDAPALSKTSAPVLPGAIQWTEPDAGIVLGVACGTMGGYPHLAQIVSADLDRLAQARPGDVLRFVILESAEAWRLERQDRTGREVWANRIASVCGRSQAIELVDSGRIRYGKTTG